ncbi:MAG: mismatch repair protein MutS, partial [Clostridia bacterium]|nr:mismatch repair protein MutS [Clostridia bacterium]
VARLAGLPEEVLQRARQLLEQQPERDTRLPGSQARKIPLVSTEKQVLQELVSFNLIAATPLEAMERIFRWQQQLQKQQAIVPMGRR